MIFDTDFKKYKKIDIISTIYNLLLHFSQPIKIPWFIRSSLSGKLIPFCKDITAIKAKMHKNGPYPVPLKMLSNTHFLTDFQKLNCRRKMRTRAKSFVLWKKMSYEVASLLKKPSKTFEGFLAAKPASNQKTCEVKLWENGEIYFYAKFQVSILMFTTFYRIVL